MAYNTECSGTPQISQNYSGTAISYYRVYKGRVWAQRFLASSKCLDTVQFYARNPLAKTVNFHIEIRKDDVAKPMGIPLQDDAGLVSRFLVNYSDLSPIADWVYISIPTVLDSGSYYWLCFVPSDFESSPLYNSTGYERFELMKTDTIGNIASLVMSYDYNDAWVTQYNIPIAHVIYKLPVYSCVNPVCNIVISAT